MALGSLVGDITWLTLAILGAVTFLKSYPRVVGLMGQVGAVLLLWMAWSTWRSARAGLHTRSTPGSLKLGYFTVLASPVSFAWWLAGDRRYVHRTHRILRSLFLCVLLAGEASSFRPPVGGLCERGGAGGIRGLRGLDQFAFVACLMNAA